MTNNDLAVRELQNVTTLLASNQFTALRTTQQIDERGGLVLIVEAKRRSGF
jgi:hypothetical protein